VVRSAQLAGGAFGPDGDVPILRFMMGHNASDLGPLRAPGQQDQEEGRSGLSETRLRAG
jgi:hypothetical protein